MSEPYRISLVNSSTGPSATSEVWLDVLSADGSYAPLPGTGPIRLPPAWLKAIAAHTETNK